ncbi:helix-turn-helix domain-containing protein [Streptomyces sp. NPDC096013]|uniref:helix-turn-helix domain-containing protein n=1 Tax=Streptomyces sp. NPDC096013 TaxID=3366069 RepID=UPI003821BD43
MSQRRLAELAGTGQAAISRIKSGRDLPTLALLERIAALDCQLTVTFTSSSRQTPPHPDQRTKRENKHRHRTRRPRTQAVLYSRRQTSEKLHDRPPQPIPKICDRASFSWAKP